jgi:hypothetical protein
MMCDLRGGYELDTTKVKCCVVSPYCLVAAILMIWCLSMSLVRATSPAHLSLSDFITLKRLAKSKNSEAPK